MQWTGPEPGHGRDATDLGWKLAATIAGWAPKGLLYAWEAERHPIGAEVLEWTRGQVAPVRPDPKVAPLRGAVADLMGTRDGMTAIGNRISGVMQRVALSTTSLRETLFWAAWYPT